MRYYFIVHHLVHTFRITAFPADSFLLSFLIFFLILSSRALFPVIPVYYFQLHS